MKSPTSQIFVVYIKLRTCCVKVECSPLFQRVVGSISDHVMPEHVINMLCNGSPHSSEHDAELD